MRVLMLGPVVLAISLLASRLRNEDAETKPEVTTGDRPVKGRLAIDQFLA